MNKRRLHHLWRRFRAVKPWYFLAATLVLGTIMIVALRANNEHMIVLRDQLYKADQTNDDVQGALDRLRTYVYSHMNTDLSGGPNSPYPPIQLKYTYERLVEQTNAQANAQSAQIYTDAQHYCEQTQPQSFYGAGRVPCVIDYVSSHGLKTATTIPDDLYKFDFASPLWSPDLAGWSVLLTGLSLLLTIVSFGFYFWSKKILR